MRITNSMTVHITEYWLNKHKEKLNDASIVSASGQEINKPSDDPTAASRILTDRVAISKYGQYESNIEQAQTWVEASNTTLEAVNSLLENAGEIVSRVCEVLGGRGGGKPGFAQGIGQDRSQVEKALKAGKDRITAALHG